ncbi:MAG: hypothetical protein ACT6RF_09135 [Allorhizobium sp.]|uniref:hypothetical protein n=1 Tax=Allorhizobium sp. TaxID=633478 RepID=UPI004033616A
MNPLTQLLLAGAFVAGLATALSGASVYDRWIDDPAVAREARAEGVLSERQAWEEARRRAEILKAQKLADAQAKIDAADRLLQDQRAQERRRADAIRRAYEEQVNDAKTDPEPGCDLSQCFVPERVRKELE